MNALTSRLIQASHRNDNILAIIKARLKHESKLSKIFILQSSLDELKSMDIFTDTFIMRFKIIRVIDKYLKGIINGH